MNAQVCVNCSSTLRPGRAFILRTSQGEIIKCLPCSLRHWPMLRRSLLTALVVGTIITLLNQGTIILMGSWDANLYWKIPLTYCVPFTVVTYGALSNGRR